MISVFYYLKILRPLNVLISGLAMVISSSILNKMHDIGMVLSISSIVMLYTAAANTLNDVLDYEIDLINRPYRPIPSGHVDRFVALCLSFILFLTGALICLQFSTLSQVIGIIIAVPLMIIYSTYLKGKSLYGNFVIALMLGLSFLFAGACHGEITQMWVPMFLAFFLTLIREIIKDISDIDGDSALGLLTFPIVMGLYKSVKFTIFLIIAVSMGLLFPYINETYGDWYLIILILGVEIPLGIVVVLLIKNPSISSAIYSARILKFSTLMGLIAIYLGTK